MTQRRVYDDGRAVCLACGEALEGSDLACMVCLRPGATVESLRAYIKRAERKPGRAA